MTTMNRNVDFPHGGSVNVSLTVRQSPSDDDEHVMPTLISGMAREIYLYLEEHTRPHKISLESLRAVRVWRTDVNAVTIGDLHSTSTLHCTFTIYGWEE